MYAEKLRLAGFDKAKIEHDLSAMRAKQSQKAGVPGLQSVRWREQGDIHSSLCCPLFSLFCILFLCFLPSHFQNQIPASQKGGFLVAFLLPKRPLSKHLLTETGGSPGDESTKVSLRYLLSTEFAELALHRCRKDDPSFIDAFRKADSTGSFEESEAANHFKIVFGFEKESFWADLNW